MKSISLHKGRPVLVKPKAYRPKVTLKLRSPFLFTSPGNSSTRADARELQKAFTPPPPSTMAYEYSAEVSDESSVESMAEPEPRVTFHDKVQIRFIPSRKAYSPEDKARMWSNRQEVYNMCRKNTYEFAYESYRWQHAVEEDEFVNLNGRLVHSAYLQKTKSQKCK